MVPPRDRGEEEEPTLDVGLLGVGGQRDLEFALLNPNPVEVALEAWGLEGGAGEQLVTAWVELLGVAAGTQADVLAHWDKAPANLTQTVSTVLSSPLLMLLCIIKFSLTWYGLLI